MGVQPRRGGSDRAEGGWCRAGEGVGGRGRGLCPGAGAGRAGLPPPPPLPFGAVPGRLPLFKDNKNKLDDRKSGVIGVIWARASSPGWRGFAC